MVKGVRLKPEEIKAIKEIVYTFDKDAQIIIYGSRADLSKKGGDIDILIISKSISLKDLLKIKAKLFKFFGDRKIDIIVAKDSKQNAFVELAYKTGVLLWRIKKQENYFVKIWICCY